MVTERQEWRAKTFGSQHGYIGCTGRAPRPLHEQSAWLGIPMFVATVIGLFLMLSSRAKVAFGPHYAQPAVSYAVLGAVTAVATFVVLLVLGVGSLA